MADGDSTENAKWPRPFELNWSNSILALVVAFASWAWPIDAKLSKLERLAFVILALLLIGIMLYLIKAMKCVIYRFQKYPYAIAVTANLRDEIAAARMANEVLDRHLTDMTSRHDTERSKMDALLRLIYLHRERLGGIPIVAFSAQSDLENPQLYLANAFTLEQGARILLADRISYKPLATFVVTTNEFENPAIAAIEMVWGKEWWEEIQIRVRSGAHEPNNLAAMRI